MSVLFINCACLLFSVVFHIHKPDYLNTVSFKFCLFAVTVSKWVCNSRTLRRNHAAVWSASVQIVRSGRSVLWFIVTYWSSVSALNFSVVRPSYAYRLVELSLRFQTSCHRVSTPLWFNLGFYSCFCCHFPSFFSHCSWAVLAQAEIFRLRSQHCFLPLAFHNVMYL